MFSFGNVPIWDSQSVKFNLIAWHDCLHACQLSECMCVWQWLHEVVNYKEKLLKYIDPDKPSPILRPLSPVRLCPGIIVPLCPPTLRHWTQYLFCHLYVNRPISWSLIFFYVCSTVLIASLISGRLIQYHSLEGGSESIKNMELSYLPWTRILQYLGLRVSRIYRALGQS